VDGESDSVTITFNNASLPSGAKVRYNSKLMNITYTLPKTVNASSTFTDTFTYTLSDGTANSTGTVTVTVNPITVASVTAWNGNALGTVCPSSRIILNGTHFGIQAPNVGLVYTDNGVQKVQKLKIISQPQYTDYSGKANTSYTNLDKTSSSFGNSSLTLEIPSKWEPGTYSILIDNGADSDTSGSITVGTGANTAPVGQDDDITLYSGSGSPYFLIDVLADNGFGVDTDNESDNVTIVLTSKTSTQGGRVSFDKKSGKVKYIRPKASFTTLAEFTDTFRYRLEDAQHKGTGNECTVTITVKNSK
jgi:hypothetical protein